MPVTMTKDVSFREGADYQNRFSLFGVSKIKSENKIQKKLLGASHIQRKKSDGEINPNYKLIP